uniref:Uncharacterized protein n=1 Tax=Rhizophora mucronata TaxID=61149 RepID=A0A2P2J4C0_RHIMU
MLENLKKVDKRGYKGLPFLFFFHHSLNQSPIKKR